MPGCNTLLNHSNYTIETCETCNVNCRTIYRHPDLCIFKCNKNATVVTAYSTGVSTSTTFAPTEQYTSPSATEQYASLSATKQYTSPSATEQYTTSYGTTKYYTTKYYVTLATEKTKTADLNTLTTTRIPNDKSIVLDIVFLCILFIVIVILVICLIIEKKKEKSRNNRLVLPLNTDDITLDINTVPKRPPRLKDDPFKELRDAIVKKILDEVISKVAKQNVRLTALPPKPADAAMQLLTLRKAKKHLLKRRKESQLRKLVLKNMRRMSTVNSVRESSTEHKPLKKSIRIKEIFEEAKLNTLKQI